MSFCDNFLISVIIPFFNAETKIPLFLESLKNQDIDMVQFVFVDDGSTDNSINLIKQYFESVDANYVILSKGNGGVSSARNCGLNFAKGKYIIFIDSDDALVFDAISGIKKTINENPEAEIFIFEYVRFSEKNKDEALNYVMEERYILEADTSVILYDYISGELIKRVHVCSCLYRRDFLNKKRIQFDENYSYGEDQKFVIDCLVASKVVKYFKCSILAYIDYENSATGLYSQKWFHSYQIFSSIYKRGEFLRYNKEIENRMNNELLTISNKIILLNGFFESLNFIKSEVIPFKSSVHKFRFWLLFSMPVVYVFSYRLYKAFK